MDTVKKLLKSDVFEPETALWILIIDVIAIVFWIGISDLTFFQIVDDVILGNFIAIIIITINDITRKVLESSGSEVKKTTNSDWLVCIVTGAGVSFVLLQMLLTFLAVNVFQWTYDLASDTVNFVTSVALLWFYIGGVLYRVDTMKNSHEFLSSKGE